MRRTILSLFVLAVAAIVTAWLAVAPDASAPTSLRSPKEPAKPVARNDAAASDPGQHEGTVATTDTHRQVQSRRPVNHCVHNRRSQKAIVSIAAQHMWMCARHRTVYSTAVTTGMTGRDTETPTGNYWIQGRNRNTVLNVNLGNGRYKDYPVKYWIPFDAPLYGFHDSSWQHFPYGDNKYRTDGSHGCVHMPLRAIVWFYRWVARPTAVHIA